MLFGVMGNSSAVQIADDEATRRIVTPEDEPLLPETISETNIEMRGRFAQQWRQEDGTLVVMFRGEFGLDMGGRTMSSDDAVVWINSGLSQPDSRKYYELTVYLWRNAEVREAGGTVTMDETLLVSNLRTFGRVVKQHDGHAPENLEESPLYKQALRDRALIESQRIEPVTLDTAAPGAEIGKPAEVFSPRVKKKPREVRYRIPQAEPATTADGKPVLVARGGVYFAQSGGDTDEIIEIRAANAVIFTAGEGAVGIIDSLEGRAGENSEAVSEPANRSEETRVGDGADTSKLNGGVRPGKSESAAGGTARSEGDGKEVGGGLVNEIKERVAGVYLEGDVVLSHGSRFVRAERLYYDFQSSRAIILDAVLRADIPQRGVPLYVRANEIRQLSEKEFSAEKALVTTSEFYSPHYHIGAERVYVRDTTPRDSGGRMLGPAQGEYELRNATMNVEGVPIAWWPYSKGTFQASETSLRSFRTAYSDDNGATIETAWHLFNLLGKAPPPGFDATLRLDYYHKRGPGAGVNVDYERPEYYGLLRTYGMIDKGEDSLGPLADNTPEQDERGRVLLRHRQFLPDGWQATIETSYICDPNYLQEWEPSEFFEGKEQETLFYLKRSRGVDAITLLANWRLLDFLTQTEHLPELAYRRIGDVLNPLVFYHESRVGMVRYRPDDRKFFDLKTFEPIRGSDLTFRTDVREEVEAPLKLGPVNIAPFATLRGTFWDGAIDHEGGLWRGLGAYGVRGSTMFSRVYEDIESELLDIHGLRHIVKPEAAIWWSHSNTRSAHMYRFDEGIETIDDFYGAMFAVRQTWQTKRGPADNRRTVDLLTVNLETGFFGDRQDEESNGYANPIRPEDSRTRNYIAGDVTYRLSDTTSLLYDFNVDVNDWSLDHHAVSLAVERLPRLAYVFGYRRAGDIDMDLIGGGFNYKLSEKHIFAVRDWYDIDRGDNGELSLSYVRKLPRWYFAVNFEYSEVDDDFSVNVSLWPEGVPEWTIGSRKMSGIGRGMGIRP